MPPTRESVARAARRASVSPPALAPDRPKLILAGVALFALAVVAFLPAVRAGFIWDDDAHVTANPTVIGPAGLREIWTTSAANYFPLVLTTFRAVYAVFGLNPHAFHVVTLLFHASSAVLLWLVLRELKLTTPSRATTQVSPATYSVFDSVAWLGAALWAVHPVQTESVAWISELKNTESALFYLAAIWFWLRWHTSDAPRSWTYYGLALGSAILALASKPSTVMLPAALLLAAWWIDGQRGRRGTWLRTALAVAPFVALSGITAAWAIWEQKYHQHALGIEWEQTLSQRFEIAGRAVWFYLGKLLWPAHLLFVYSRWALDAPSAAAFLPLFGLVAGFGGLVFAVRRTAARALLFASAYFVALLFPVLGFFTVYYFRYSFVADHFQYLASMGPLVLAAAGLTMVAPRLPRAARFALPALLIAWLAVSSWRQTSRYHSATELYESVLSENPDCWLAHNNLARILTENGNLDQAIAHCRTSLQLHPTPVAHFNLGLALMQKGSADEALSEYHAAIALDPAMVEAYGNLGVLLATLGRTDEAEEVYRRAIQVEPNSAAIHDHWGLLASAHGEYASAIEHYRKALEQEPRAADTYDHLGVAFAQLRRNDEALDAFGHALALAPENVAARHHTGQILALEGKTNEAIAAYRIALDLRPDLPDVRLHLGVALQQAGRFEEAAAEFGAALELNPRLSEARQRLEALRSQRAGPPTVPHP